MVKLTVLYNLPDGADHDAFLEWRTSTHQANNAKPPVIKTDFYVAKATPMGQPHYRYITEAYFPDMASLEASFFSEAAQEKLQKDVERIHEPIFLISEEVVTTIVDTGVDAETG
jgi:hypothetical protein